MSFASELPRTSALRAAVTDAYLADETQCIENLLKEATLPRKSMARAQNLARLLVDAIRQKVKQQGGIEAFMQEYSLTSEEGVVLMCLAEALLRIPDKITAEKLIQDKLAHGNWRQHLGSSSSLFVNASTWGLVLTGKVLDIDGRQANSIFDKILSRSGEPFIRVALKKAMRNLGEQYVIGENMDEALFRSRRMNRALYRFSYDMLGEAALTREDADRYFYAYSNAIDAMEDLAKEEDDIFNAPSISVKLSALNPRFEFSQRKRILGEVTERVLFLAQKARSLGIALTIDAEESDRLDLLLDVFVDVYRAKELKEWEGFGLAVQTYQKRASYVIDWLTDLAWTSKKRIPVRLVKGAYWDTEIKRAQEKGFRSYPVFTRKQSTDVSYLACARRMLASRDAFYPQFATHNALTVAAITEIAGDYSGYEFQRLYGMGDELYEELYKASRNNATCRVYAPVGNHEDLLPYLVRRLLENGANTNFVHRIVHDETTVEEIVADPAEIISMTQPKHHPKIPLPPDLFKSQRRNSKGINLDNRDTLETLNLEINRSLAMSWTSGPIIGGETYGGQEKSLFNPADRLDNIGVCGLTDFHQLETAIQKAKSASTDWDQLGGERRAEILEKAAGLLEQNQSELLALVIKEGGRTLRDAISELREAVDFCLYYAHLARKINTPIIMPGPTGELNNLRLVGRGTFACVSPWNFPLAIFTGQIAAALAAGNSVIAKPASQTPFTAYRVVKLFHKAGIPGDILHLVPGDGKTIGNKLITSQSISGVAFTGSTETARSMNLLLASRPGPIIPLIAETGGLNTMIVDSSALPEQVVQDVLTSSFNSAGQRCSALRILFVQDDMADELLKLLCGAAQELVVGNPAHIETDVGPIIDEKAKKALVEHRKLLQKKAKLLFEYNLPPVCRNGHFYPPSIYEIGNLDFLKKEVFGPILHVVRYHPDMLDKVIESINNTGYGLTLGIHSRIDSTINYITQRVKVGNTYVNRNMIGAVVGSQPFGGEGLSGTGPKAGGPHYLHRFMTERHISVNTTAVGGNASLITLAGKDS